MGALFKAAPVDTKAAGIEQQALARFHATQEPQGGQAAQLTGNLPPHTEGFAEHSAHYHKFLSAVSTVLGDLSSPEKWHMPHLLPSVHFRTCPTLQGTPTNQPPGLPGVRRVPPRQPKGGGARSTWTLGCSSQGFGRGDEPIRAMLLAHAPLVTWLRQHRAQPASSKSAASASGGGARSAATPGMASEMTPRTPRTTMLAALAQISL